MEEFLEKVADLLSFRYYVYWVEFLVIISIVVLAVYLGYALNLFKRD